MFALAVNVHTMLYSWKIICLVCSSTADDEIQDSRAVQVPTVESLLTKWTCKPLLLIFPTKLQANKAKIDQRRASWQQQSTTGQLTMLLCTRLGSGRLLRRRLPAPARRCPARHHRRCRRHLGLHREDHNELPPYIVLLLLGVVERSHCCLHVASSQKRIFMAET